MSYVYPMNKYTVKLLKRELVAENTVAFYFEKPNNFTYIAGQYVDLAVIDPPETDTEGNTRSFSLASAPSESDLMIATRMRDTAMKRYLRTMPLGTEVEITDAMGSFTLHHDTTKPTVFLMGGIGITPARSMVIQAAYEKKPHHLFLFYSNRRPEDAAFLPELMVLERQNPNYRCIPTMTDMEKSKRAWDGGTGFIDVPLLKTHLSDLNAPIYYISGPPTMVAAMRNILDGANTNPDNIKTEEFSGY